ncbi:MAG: hypothetical protein WC454_10135 [Phycisphaerae bacterium]|jgi:hypothetical protein
MTETKETLGILKARWPEVTLIIGLNVLSIIANKLLLISQTNTTPYLGLINGGFIFTLMIIIALLTTGFQRTACLEGPKQQSPAVLLRTGSRFFWRIVGFGLIYLPVLGILVWLSFLVIKQFASIETGFWETAKAHPFIYQLCFTISALILIKPFLLIGPLIIVLDCRISDSFKLLKQYKLLDAKELLLLFFVSSALILISASLPSLKSATTLSLYSLIMTKYIMQHFISLMMAVMAVRFVASRNLVYDDGSKSVDSQTLLKP